MAIFDGRYSWNGIKEKDKEPIAWFPGAYDVTIVDLTDPSMIVTHLKPYLCIFTNTGSGYSVSANPENFAKRICEDFSLNIEKVLWVEQSEINSENYDVITFSKSIQLGENVFYAMRKRKPMPNELKLIQKEKSGNRPQ